MRSLHHHYSGEHSSLFWKRVNKLTTYNHESLYTAGVLLQNMEETILCWLKNAESAETAKRTRRKRKAAKR